MNGITINYCYSGGYRIREYTEPSERPWRFKIKLQSETQVSGFLRISTSKFPIVWLKENISPD